MAGFVILTSGVDRGWTLTNLTDRNIIIKTYQKTSNDRSEVCQMGFWPILQNAFRNCSCTYMVWLPTRTYGTSRCLGSISSIRIELRVVWYACFFCVVGICGLLMRVGDAQECLRFLQIITSPPSTILASQPYQPTQSPSFPSSIVSYPASPYPSLGLISYILHASLILPHSHSVLFIIIILHSPSPYFSISLARAFLLDVPLPSVLYLYIAVLSLSLRPESSYLAATVSPTSRICTIKDGIHYVLFG